MVIAVDITSRMSMATKAEQFKTRMQRTAGKGSQARRRKRAKKAAAEQSTTPRALPGAKQFQNLSTRAARKAEVKLEASQSGRPSRKSTRRSANKGKLASNLERRQIRRTVSPQSRAVRARSAARAS
jgi:hypothetical protein